jgi:hypothetical protein
MIKYFKEDFKEDPNFWTLVSILLVCFAIILSLKVVDSKRSKLTERDYYNKFCTKNFDVSCNNINLK